MINFMGEQNTNSPTKQRRLQLNYRPGRWGVGPLLRAILRAQVVALLFLPAAYARDGDSPPVNRYGRTNPDHSLPGSGETPPTHPERAQTVGRAAGDHQTPKSDGVETPLVLYYPSDRPPPSSSARAQEDHQPAQQEENKSRERHQALEKAYKLINERRYAEALPILEEIARQEPNNLQVRKQLGYLHIQLGRQRDAITEFLAVEKLTPEDYEIKLQLGYLYDSVKERERAIAKFTEALASTDPEVKRKARQALANLSSSSSVHGGTFFGEVYAEPFFQSRFDNFISPFFVRLGVSVKPKRGIDFYTSLRFSRDSRSAGGTAPQIFSDNFAVIGVGVRGRPFKNNLTAYAEAGVAVNMVRSPLSNVKARSDYRAGIYYAKRWGEEAETDGLTAPLSLNGDVYFDTSYYSRFRNNVISYLQVREGVRILQWRDTSLDAYVRLAAVKDINRDFFNNLGEGGLGLRFTPRRSLGMSISAEYVRGVYFGIERRNEPNPYRPQYNDFRISLVFGKYFLLRGSR